MTMDDLAALDLDRLKFALRDLFDRLSGEGRHLDAALVGAVGQLAFPPTVSAGDPPDGPPARRAKSKSPAVTHKHKYDPKTGLCSCGTKRLRAYAPRKGHQFDLDESAPSTANGPPLDAA